ncbi:TIGR03089 family protein [Naumannella sp. ID2617S]|nr:TIGR03089 family protein [Naumannella sp. ID2617S]
MTLLTDHLSRRCRVDGSAPFLTHYSPAGRTELSVRSFANWVDKTANLLIDEFELAEGDRVRLTLAEQHPGHWMTLVWAAACWRAGVTVTDAEAELTVAGPAADPDPDGTPTVSCSLHPLALPQRDLLAGVRDFSAEALAQPDAWLGVDPDPETPAVALAAHRASLAELAGLDGIGGRLLLTDPTALWSALLTGLIQPLIGDGSRVITEGVSHDEVTRIVATERVDRP